MTDIFIDVETAITDQQWAMHDIMDNIRPPGNIKKAESIEKWMKENSSRVYEEKLANTALDTSLARIICLGYAVEMDEPQSITGPENYILNEFFHILTDFHHGRLVGHNIIAFDIPLIFHRAIIHSIRPHRLFHTHYTPWGGDCFDTMTEWAGRDRISLDRLCKLLGLPGKGDIDGSMIPEMYAAGKIDEIAEYCRQDVAKVQSVYRRIIGG